MPSLLFITPVPLKPKTARPNTCMRRPRILACVSNPDEQDREIGEPSWMNLSRDMSPSDVEDIPRTPPKWEYPEGDPGNVGEDNPWKKWNAAIENEPSLEHRDVKAETDFWRSAARDLADETNESNTVQAEQPIKGPPDDILTDEPNQPVDVWRMARGVTGEMTQLQEKLRSELERYNPEENTDQYRDIARELVGPPEETWENSNPIRASESEAEAGSGWNPDVDWMRFDDVRREQAKAVDKAARDEAQRAAREQMGVIGDDNSSAFQGVDEELTKTFTDQSVDESFIRDNPTGNLPGFLTNRLKSRGTYGGGWSGAEEEARKLQQQGVPLRNPKADSDQWRNVARELNLDVGAGTEEGNEKGVGPETKLEDRGSDSKGEVENATKKLEEITISEKGTENMQSTSDVGEESSWSSWRSSSANWESANEKAEARDPAKEVDMWRSSARELISGNPASEQTTSDIQSETTQKGTVPGKEGNAWDQWRSANAQWESSFSGANAESDRQGESTWGSSEQSDWGAGIGGKTTSERSAWEQWNNVSSMNGSSGSSLWWNTRNDFSFKAEDKPDRSLNNADEWRGIARETLNIPEKESNSTPSSRDERIEKDTTLDSWRSMAKDLIEDKD